MKGARDEAAHYCDGDCNFVHFGWWRGVCVPLPQAIRSRLLGDRIGSLAGGGGWGVYAGGERMGAVARAGVVSVSCRNQRARFDGKVCISFGVAAGDGVCVAEAAGVGVFQICRESQLSGWTRRVSKPQIADLTGGANIVGNG